MRPLTLSDLVKIEERFGGLQGLLEELALFRAVAIRFLVWQLLRRDAPDLDEEAVGDLIPST